MGQYYLLVNLSKREYICPWCIGGGAKLWEWAANSQGALVTLLLRHSSEGGGGDVDEVTSPVGTWAGHRLAMVGDYDDSGVYDLALRKFRNISQEAARVWNAFMGGDQWKLDEAMCESCRRVSKSPQ